MSFQTLFRHKINNITNTKAQHIVRGSCKKILNIECVVELDIDMRSSKRMLQIIERV